MLDQEALEIACDRLSAESVQWQRSFDTKLQRVQNELSIKGQGASGALIEAVADLCAQQVETRANRVWEVLRGLLQGAKGLPSNEDVKKLYSDFDRLYITYCYSEPQRRFDEVCQRLGQSATDLASFETRAIATRLRVVSEINEFLRSLRAVASNEKSPPPMSADGGQPTNQNIQSVDRRFLLLIIVGGLVQIASLWARVFPQPYNLWLTGAGVSAVVVGIGIEFHRHFPRAGWTIAAVVLLSGVIEVGVVRWLESRSTSQPATPWAGRPSIAPSGYIFNNCGNAPSVSLENFWHEPVKVSIWTGQQISVVSLPHGPPLSKQQSQKIVIPNALQGERIDFDNFSPTKFGSSCYLSGLIEYSFLSHRYCTRFCRYLTPRSAVEHPCADSTTNKLEKDKGCDQYHTGLPQQ